MTYRRFILTLIVTKRPKNYLVNPQLLLTVFKSALFARECAKSTQESFVRLATTSVKLLKSAPNAFTLVKDLTTQRGSVENATFKATTKLGRKIN